MEDRLIDIEEAAKILCTSTDFLYRHWQEFPFARKLSRKQLRFSARGIDEWLRQGNNGATETFDKEGNYARKGV